MKIKIAERLRPFSHTPGASCLIPGTCFAVTAFPTLLRIDQHEIKLKLTGPVSNFTLQQDLEKNCVFVFGKAKEGHFRICIEASDSGFDVAVLKGQFLRGKKIKQSIPFHLDRSIERLSLGNHKLQDWDEVQKRGDLAELLPALFLLGQKIPPIPQAPLQGTGILLKLPKERRELISALESFFKAAFSKILIPRLIDDQYQGLVEQDDSINGDPCLLIQEGFKVIRALFFQQNQRRLQFLGTLPVSLHSGRMVGIQAPGIGEIDFEWSKKILRAVILRVNTTGDLIFDLQKEIKSFRVNKKKNVKVTEPLLVEEGKTYYLDRFEK